MRASRTAMALILCLGVGAPLLAQSDAPLDKRVNRLESEMRAVQRKVFPGGDRKYFEPEFPPTGQGTPAAPAGIPATSPIADLTSRVDALERQLATLTGQVEQTAFKQRQLEEALNKFRADAEFRMTRLEGGTPPTAPGTTAPSVPGATVAAPTNIAPASATPATAAVPPTPAADPAAAAAKPADPIEAEWNAAYALVKAQDYAKAEPLLQAIISKYPKHDRAASAQFWLGRSYYAQKSYAQAAKAFLSSYQVYPKALRGPDSLYWLGQSLVGLGKTEQACQAYNEFQAVFAAKASAGLKDQVATARTAAKCDA